MTGPARASRPRPGRRGNHNHDERGMTLAFVAIGFAGLFAASIFAIDLGVLMTARSQAQNSADAGAHAGAVALIMDDYNDRTADGPAVTNAVQRALSNQVMGANVFVTPAEVDFPQGPTGLYNRVRVRVYRDAAHGNPVGTFIGAIARLFPASWGTAATVDVNAVAVAQASPTTAVARCLPFTIPDMWEERTEPPFVSDSSTFDLFDRRGNALANPDNYVPWNAEGYTGYNPLTNKGDLIVLKASNDNKVSPSMYNPITVTGMDSTGAARYRDAIINGPCGDFPPGARMVPEPGNMQGPTVSGIEQLINSDPDAYWDRGCNCVKGSTNPDNPRVAAIPLYDPYQYETGKQTGRNAEFIVANYLGVFIEGMRGNEVVARITPILGGPNQGGGPVPAGAFPMVVRIVE